MSWRTALLIVTVAGAVLVPSSDVDAGQPGGPDHLTPIVPTANGIGGGFTVPDRAMVIYTTHPRMPGPHDIWALPVRGGSSTRLTPDTTDASSIQFIVVTPDSAHVVYDRSLPTQNEDSRNVYSSPVGGGTPKRLVGPLGGDHPVEISRLEVSSDSSRAVYSVTSTEAAEAGIWSVAVSGGPPLRLTAEPTASFELLPDASRVVYSTASGLFSVPLIGGPPVRLYSLQPPATGIDLIKVSPDSARVVLRTTYGFRNSPFELLSALSAGGAVVELGAAMPVEGRYRGVEITPDSSRVVFQATPRGDDLTDVFSVPIEGGPPTRLNQDLGSSGTTPWFGVADDSQSVVYLTDADRNGTRQLFAVSPRGGSPRSLSGPLPTGITISRDPVLSPDSTRVVFVQNRLESPGQDQRLQSVSLVGGPSIDLARPLEFVGRTFEFTVTPDSSRVILLADPNLFDAPGIQAGLYSIPIGGGVPVRLADPSALAGEVTEWSAVQTVGTNAIVFLTDDTVSDDGKTIYAVGDGVVRCAGRPATIVGTDSPDVLTGSLGPDVILAGAGADDVDGGGGDDVICGQEGDDTIDGGEGADTISGGDGDDVIDAGPGPDQVQAGPGADEVRGGSGADVLNGDSGADRIFGGSSGDTIDGGSGKDELRGQSGADTIYGRKGADRIFGGSSGDTIDGGSGKDELRGQSGADTIYGRKGADRIFGNKGADVIRGGSGGDTLRGGSGSDTLRGGSGRDTLRGGSGGDALRGGSGRDRCIGGPGRDRLSSCE